MVARICPRCQSAELIEHPNKTNYSWQFHIFECGDCGLFRKWDNDYESRVAKANSILRNYDVYPAEKSFLKNIHKYPIISEKQQSWLKKIKNK